MKMQYRDGGFTLVEMLVVVAIIAIVAGISIPVAVRYSSLGENDIQRSAQALQDIIRAAKIYSSTNNVRSAVVYSLGAEETSYGDGYRRIINGFAVVRELTRDELRNIQVADGVYSSQSDLYFTPVRDPDGAFQRFEGATCMAFWREEPEIEVDGNFINPLSLVDMSQPNQEDEVERDMGMKAIYVLDTYVDEGTGLLTGEYVFAPANLQGIPLGFPALENSFPAHIFKPSGSLENPSPKQRFTLYITRLPSDTVEELFARQTAVGSGIPRAATLDLFATLGRIRLN